jgi:energy-coupling factor transporter ATP-binding protein EcfA2
MKIHKLTIKNFKFFINETCEFDGKNALIYGENGTGKSSLYFALYRKINNENKIQNYKNRFSNDEEIGVEIFLKEDDKPESKFSNNVQCRAYFINHSILTKVINADDFFDSIMQILHSNFRKIFETILSQVSYINLNITPTTPHDDLQRIRSTTKRDMDSELKRIIEKLQLFANEILKKFNEKFILSFDIAESYIGSESESGFGSGVDLKFTLPNIKIKINNIEKIKENFNEATLKLSSLAIFFALIDIESEMYTISKSDGLKLLVLDDILLSIDMGNRITVTKYIYENHTEFQKFILTHSTSYFLLFQRMIDSDKKNKKNWSIQVIYKQELSENIFIPQLSDRDKSNDYILKAENALKENDLENVGNNLRKELEIQTQKLFKAIDQGKGSSLDTLNESIKENVVYYKNPQELLRDIINTQKIDITESNKLDTPRVKKSLKEVLFIKNIILNKASHSNKGEQFYQSELTFALKYIKELKSIVKELLDER